MATTPKPDFGAGIPLANLREGQPLAGTVDGEPVILVRQGDGRICALAGKCTHLSAPLEQGMLVEGELRCPWHHARFSVDTGEAIAAPAIAPLERFETVQDGERLRVLSRRCAHETAETARQDAGHIVIVGGGAAGYACADILARAGQGERVTLLSGEGDAPYDRTFCSKQYLAGKAERADCAMPAPGLGLGPAPQIRTDVQVTAIDIAARELQTARGERIGFDKLILATGAEPVRPDIPGMELPQVHMLRSLRDADALIEAAGSARKAVVLGASFIGLEVAASLRQRGLEVAVVCKDTTPLAAKLGEEAGRFVQKLHEDKGVVFHRQHGIQRFEPGAAVLDDGTRLEADLFVVGTGVAPRVELAERCGIALASQDEGGGIRVDDRLETSSPGIYAIGDVANYPDLRLGHRVRVEHWVHAERQGQYLARQLLGEVGEGFGDTPFFWSAHYGTSLRYVGHADEVQNRSVEGDVTQGNFVVSFRSKGQLQAVLTCKRDKDALQAEAAWDVAAAAE